MIVISFMYQVLSKGLFLVPSESGRWLFVVLPCYLWSEHDKYSPNATTIHKCIGSNNKNTLNTTLHLNISIVWFPITPKTTLPTLYLLCYIHLLNYTAHYMTCKMRRYRGYIHLHCVENWNLFFLSILGSMIYNNIKVKEKKH